MKKRTLAAALILALCVLASACARSMSPSFDKNSERVTSGSTADSPTDENGSVGKTSTVISDAQTRKLIKDVSMDVETKEFDTFVAKLQTEIAAQGGYVQKSEINNGGYSSDYRYTSLVARIPAEKLGAFTGAVSSLGNVVSQSESVQDVTMTYVDMESKLKALRTEQASLLKLLENANNLSDILTIQNRLTEVRGSIESYESQLRTYDNLVAYSTVTMEIREVERETVVKKQTMWQEIGGNFTQNLTAIGKGFRAFFVWVISVSPYQILLALFGAVIWLIVRRSLRKSREIRKTMPATPMVPPYGIPTRPAAPAPTAPAPPPAPPKE